MTRRWNGIAAAAAFAGCGVCVALPVAAHRDPRADSVSPVALEGFVVQRVAGPPLVKRPMLGSFDDRGRLYVAESAGADLGGAELARTAPHRIVVLEDSDGDGRFDTSVVFADELVSPQGLLWHDGDVFLASPPSLWRLRDTDGDGAADERRELITGFALTGGGDEMRGASLGPDGLIYTCAGRLPHDLKDIDGKPLHKGAAPLLVRCRPDGSGAEVVSGLMGNPAGLAWSAQGDAFVSGALFGGEGTRDAIIHAVEGGTYPVLGLAPEQQAMKRTGEPLPALVRAGETSPAGMTRYRGFTLGRTYTGSLLCAYGTPGRVRRHTLARHGSTFVSSDEDFLTSGGPGFDPTDVVDDADGSVLVLDRGGPLANSAGKTAGEGAGAESGGAVRPPTLGGIYRVSRDRAVRIADPRGNRLKWDNVAPLELARRLEDLRWAVSDRAALELAKGGDEAANVLAEVLGRRTNAATRLNAVWALTRMRRPAARAAARIALTDRDGGVRQAAAYSAGLHEDAGATPLLIELLRTDTPHVRREAATALGRIWQRRAAPVPATSPTQTQPSSRPTTATSAGATAPRGVAEVAAAPAGAPVEPGNLQLGPGGQPAQPAAPATPAAPPPPPSPAVPVLLEALRGSPDRFLEHAVVYALIRIGDRAGTTKGLQDPDASVSRGARLALDQMGPDESASGPSPQTQPAQPAPGPPG